MPVKKCKDKQKLEFDEVIIKIPHVL